MGKMKENPRYNIVSCRASDQEYAAIIAALDGRTMADFLLQAAMDKIIAEQQSHYNQHLRACGL